MHTLDIHNINNLINQYLSLVYKKTIARTDELGAGTIRFMTTDRTRVLSVLFVCIMSLSVVAPVVGASPTT